MKSLKNLNRSSSKKNSKGRLARKFTASLSLAGLLMASPVPLYAQAQAQPQGGGIDLEQVPHGELLSGILGLTTQITQQIGASRAQTQAMIQSQQMMSQLAPQSIPAKFFPQCQIPVTAPNLPMGYCDNSPSSPYEFEMMNNMVEIAANYERYYKMMLTQAQNSPFPSGTKCLNDGKTAVLSSMVDRQNALQVLIDRINKETQLFRDENERFLKEMDDLHAELYGGQTNTTDNKTLSFANEFSPECRQIIGSDKLTPNAARAGGLMTLQDGFRDTQDKAVEYQLNKNNIEASYNKFLQDLTSSLSSNGIMETMNEFNVNQQLNQKYQGAGKIQFATINESLDRRIELLNNKRKQIEGELQRTLGSSTPGESFKLPELNRTFAKDFDRFIQRSEEFYRKKYIGDCVSGRSSGVGLSTDQLIQSLQSHASKENGTNYRRYIERLEAVLKSDSFIEDKMAEISQIDRSFNSEVILTNFRSESTSGAVTPYQFLQQAIAACESVYLEDQTYSSTGNNMASASSRKQAVSRAKNLMKEYQEEVADFQTNLISEIENKMRNCDGRSYTPTSCSSTDVFDTTKVGFCLSNAAACSSNVQSCNARVTELIEQRKSKIKVAGAQFNKAAEELITRQEQILNQVRNQVLADAEYLKKYFPGADYVYPEDLFVKLPKQELKNGEMLYGGGKIDFKDLAQNVGKLKQQLKTQSSEIEKVLDSYIRAQEKQIADNRKDWANVAMQCRGSAQAFAQAQAQQQAEQAQQQQETNQELANFCRKFNNLASTENPAAGCSGPFSPESLFEDSMKISAYIDDKAKGALGSYTALCNQTQNERKKGSESDSTSSFNFLTACKSGSQNIKDRLISDAKDGIPSQFQEHTDDIVAYLKGTGSLPAAISEDKAYLRILEDLYVKISSTSDRALQDFKNDLTSKGATPAFVQRFVDAVSDSIGGSDDELCKRVAFTQAKEALTGASDGVPKGETDKFMTNLEKKLESANKDFDSISRGIASTGGGADQEWKRIGEAVTGNCEAYNNVTRDGGLLGELFSNPTDGLDLRSLGIGR